jgi:5-methylcytosine-specific restriction protein A
MNLVPAGVRNCHEHKSRWEYGRGRVQRTSTTHWKSTRLRILRRDSHTCVYCGAPAETVDHIVASAHGGSDDDTNLVAACESCNERKRALESMESRVKRQPT